MTGRKESGWPGGLCGRLVYLGPVQERRHADRGAWAPRAGRSGDFRHHAGADQGRLGVGVTLGLLASAAWVALCRASGALPRGVLPKAPNWVLQQRLARQSCTCAARHHHPTCKGPQPARQSATRAAKQSDLRGKGQGSPPTRQSACMRAANHPHPRGKGPRTARSGGYG